MQHSRDVPFRLLTSGHNQEMMPSSAAAVEFAGPRQVRVAAVALPEPGPDEVVPARYPTCATAAGTTSSRPTPSGSGLVLDPGDIPALAAALDRLASDEL